MSGFLPGRFKAREAEVISAHEALSWLKNFPDFPIILEMDNLHVFNALWMRLAHYIVLCCIALF